MSSALFVAIGAGIAVLTGIVAAIGESKVVGKRQLRIAYGRICAVVVEHQSAISAALVGHQFGAASISSSRVGRNQIRLLVSLCAYTYTQPCTCSRWA